MPNRPSARAGGRLGRRLLGVIGIAAGIPAAAYGVASYLVYDRLSAAPGTCWERDRANTPAAYTVPEGFDQAIADANRMPPPVDVTFPPREVHAQGLVLRGWWIPATDPDAAAVILVHGVRSCRREANVLIPAGMLHRRSYSVLLFDLRNHGDSDDELGRSAAATREYRDVLGAWDWLIGLGIPASRIGVVGVSFGAACAIIAAAEEPRLAGVWADSSWSELGALLRYLLVRDGKSAWFAPGAIKAARFVTRDNLTSRSPLRSITRLGGRSLGIIHGGNDRDIPPSHAHALRDAAVAADVDLRELWIAEGAGHTEAVYVQPVEYEARLTRFFDGALRRRSREPRQDEPRLTG